MKYKNPAPTVDIIIQLEPESLVLVKRRFEPHGWALPGGFVDYGETLEDAARREAQEETGLEVELLEQFHTYSNPARDPRSHTISTVFIGRAKGTPKGGDDAEEAVLFPTNRLPTPICFDHSQIINDYLHYRKTGLRPPV